MISVRVPCSCGEFIQGRYGKDEALISCPIDIYSTAVVKKGKQTSMLLEKVSKSIDFICRYYNIDKSVILNLSIDVHTPLPYGKGYATSTSEMVAVIVALSTYFGKNISEIEVAKICARVEPTDSVMFESISLFKHLAGELIESVDVNLKFDIVVLELEGHVSTTEFRDKGAFDIVTDDLKDVFDNFLLGVKEHNNKLIGDSMYKSALSNQKILEKLYLHEINELAKKYGATGINVAHSGSLIGVMFEEEKDAEKFRNYFKTSKYSNIYSKDRKAKVINGGWIIDNSSGGSNGINN